MPALALLPKPLANAAPKAATRLRSVTQEEAPRLDARSLTRSGTSSADALGNNGSATSRFGHSFHQLPTFSPAPRWIQPKLKINQPGDKYEQEADRVADQVMQMPEPAVQRKCACGGSCSKCKGKRSDEEHGLLQMKRVDASSLGPSEAPPIVHEVLKESGRPLDAGTRAFMEGGFGRDFSQVRVYTNEIAQRSAMHMNAHAYTVRSSIVFGRDRFQPQSREGRALLAHELTHVLQQLSVRSMPSEANEMDAAERADCMQGSRHDIAPTLAAAPAVQFKKGDGYPKTVSIGSADVRAASNAEELEGKALIALISQRYAITIDSQKGLQVLKDSLVGDPDEPLTMEEALAHKGPKKVRDVLEASVWTVGQLRDLVRGLAFFNPVLNLLSSQFSRTSAVGKLTSISRLKVGLDRKYKHRERNTAAEFFGSSGHAAFFDSAGTTTSLSDPNMAFLGTVVHEVAHATLGHTRSGFVTGLRPAYWKDETTFNNDPKAEEPITTYGAMNAGEDLAEAVKFYFLEPLSLKQKCPQRYTIVEKLITSWNPPGPNGTPSP
jgi:Domain of unknown function (DUF4157)